jgi:hypothetical protein
MDFRENIKDTWYAFKAAFAGQQANIWTAMPVIVTAYNPEAMTVEARPTIQARITGKNGPIGYSPLPVLLDCPVVFPSGGGFSLTLPIAVGDEGLVVFASRCIDSWWALGGNQIPFELRMHDLSDGFYIPGVFSQPRTLENVSTTSVQLRDESGNTYVEIAPDGVARINATTVQVHASGSYQWDVDGYGTKVTANGDGNYTIDNYVTGAIVTTNENPINPPDAT